MKKNRAKQPRRVKKWTLEKNRGKKHQKEIAFFRVHFCLLFGFFFRPDFFLGSIFFYSFGFFYPFFLSFPFPLPLPYYSLGPALGRPILPVSGTLYHGICAWSSSTICLGGSTLLGYYNINIKGGGGGKGRIGKMGKKNPKE